MFDHFIGIDQYILQYEFGNGFVKKIMFLGTQRNHLTETLPLSTQDKC